MKIICLHKERTAYQMQGPFGATASPFHLKSLVHLYSQSTQRSMPKEDINFVLLTK